MMMSWRGKLLDHDGTEDAADGGYLDVQTFVSMETLLSVMVTAEERGAGGGGGGWGRGQDGGAIFRRLIND